MLYGPSILQVTHDRRVIAAHLWRDQSQAVQRYMREVGIAGIHPGPNLSKRNAAHPLLFLYAADQQRGINVATITMCSAGSRSLAARSAWIVAVISTSLVVAGVVAT